MNRDISVVIPVHAGTDSDDIIECIESLLDQSYDAYSILVISESEDVSELIRSQITNERVNVRDIENEDYGVSRARNIGYIEARGSIVAYIDADAEADQDWLHEMNQSYENNDVPAVGGRADPVWPSNQEPNYIPSEFLWLVGSTHSTHPKNGSTVRNTFGCNMSYKKSVLEDLGGFKENIGKKKGYNLQGEEPEIGERMKKEMNTGVYYNDNMVVRHKVSSEQLTLTWLSKRAYLQGISKAIMKSESGAELNNETRYLETLPVSILSHIKKTFTGSERRKSFLSIFMIPYFTFLVGSGYLIGRAKFR